MTDFLHNAWGTYADYQVVDAALIVSKPQNLTHVEAAVLPLAAGTAYETIIRRLAVTRGEWVLLYGAAGGVGSLALQMAVAQGAHVIAVARTHHHALLAELGAVASLDYTTRDIPALAQAIASRKLDVIVVWWVGKRSPKVSQPSVLMDEPRRLLVWPETWTS